MAFGDKIKRFFKSNNNENNETVHEKAENEKHPPENNTTKEKETIPENEVDEDVETIETQNTIGESANIKNFKYLDDLIHSGEEIISLDYDIVLDDDELSQYQNGILIDNIIYINGNGHSIDAKGKARIFKITGKKAILRDMTFKNGYDAFGGAIFIDESTYSIIERNCYFNDNKAVVDGGAIFTRGKVVVQNCYFNNNFADEDGGAISNQGILEVSFSKLTGNESKERGGSICSTDTLKIFESEFNDNVYHNGDSSVYHSGSYMEKSTYFNDINRGDRFSIGKTGNKTGENFKYLDNLIRSGDKEIVLSSDIIFNGDEDREYVEGIPIEENDIVIDGNGFSIDARKKARIFKITGHNVVLKNIIFKNALSAYRPDMSDLVNSLESFVMNRANFGGGAIQNFGKTRIESSTFSGNHSAETAGAILNLENADLEIKGCRFEDNQASTYGVIENTAKLKIEDCIFKRNISAENGGVMGNTGDLEIINSQFIYNNTSQTGAVMINGGNVKIYDSLFNENYSNGAGGTIFNQRGSLFVHNTCFKNNFSSHGGAILNFDHLAVEKSKFENNTSRDYAGAILNYEIGKAEIKNCKFKNNDSHDDGSCIFNANKISIIDSSFEENDNDRNIIYNQSELELVGLTFSQNIANSLIITEENSKVTVNGGKALDNTFNKSSIINLGEINLNNFAFDNNRSDAPLSENIYNEGRLYLTEIKISNENADKTILNKGYLEVKELTERLEKTICNEGELKFFFREKIEPPSIIVPEIKDSSFNFNHLEELIRSNNESSIEMDGNISIMDNEIDFYEGGIDLEEDGLTIDGNNKCIDGCGKTRIFNVVGKDIVLKNIMFKNGSSLVGGGAIKIVKDASLKLINCKFIGNTSLTDGGAILNNGELRSLNTDYEGNESKFKGGGIFNNGTLTVKKSSFTENKSGRGLAIYNNDSLNITDIDFDNEIFNNSSIITSIDLEENVANIGFINREKAETENFTYLFNEISKSSEISLEKDIIFNYIEDENLVNGFDIARNIKINGNNHVIDGNGSARLFNILEDAEIVFRDVVFVNCYTSEKAIIENNSILTFENCRFINNHPKFNESLIENNNELKIIGSTFSNHYIKNRSVLTNNKKLEIRNSSFICNSTESKGSVLSNFNRTDIKGSSFENNFSKEIGGAILNRESGRIDILSTAFRKNISDENGGAIYNYGDSTVLDAEFLNNSSRRNGGAIFNVLNPQISGRFVSDFVQNLLIDGCDFKNNNAGGEGGALYNGGVLDLQTSDFIENTSDIGGGIFMGPDGMAYIGFCSFKKNKADNGGAIYQMVENIRFRNCSVEDNVPNDTNLS